MSQMFDSFWSEASRQQLSLLLDTVMYFEEAPKLLSLPGLSGEHAEVPLLPETLREMLAALPEADCAFKHRFHFQWNPAGEQEGELVVVFPDGRSIRQRTDLSMFSPV